jgi:putative ABC transport system substrate-binding protein
LKRIPDAEFPYEYTLSDEDVTLVDSTFVGAFYISASVETHGTQKGMLKGEAKRNPVSVGSTSVDIVIGLRSITDNASGPPSSLSAIGSGSNRLFKIGILWSGSPPQYYGTRYDTSSVPEGLRQAFRELGYFEGQNIAFEPRYSEANYARLSELAAQLVRQKVDVILAAGDSAAVQAAKAATTTIPIVMIALADAVQLKLVSGLAYPGGNVTGLSVPLVALAAKQLQLLQQSDPKVSRVALVWNPTNPAHAVVLEGIHPLARSLNLEVEPVKLHDTSDFGDAFAAIRQVRSDAILLLWDSMFYAHGGQFADLALQNHLPTISTYQEFTQAAGLLAYGPPTVELFSGGASYTDKIIRGAKTTELPVEQPIRFDLTINVITAKALDLTLPKSIFIRADKVFR